MGQRPAQHRLRLLVAAAVSSFLAACAGLLGIDDRGLDPLLDTDGSTESSSDALPAPQDGFAGSTDAPVRGPADATGDGSGDVGVDAAASEGAPPDSGALDSPALDARGGEAGSRDATAEGAGPSDAGADGDGSRLPPVDANVQPDVAACPDPCLLAGGLNHPFLIASDANNVYWTEYGDVMGSANGWVKSCPVSGCAPAGPLVYARAVTNARGIAVDAQSVYWGTASNVGVLGGIWSAPLGGGVAPKLLTQAGWPYGVAVDATYVYWVDVIDSTVHRVLKVGGSDHVLYDGGGNLVSGKSEQVAVDTSFVFFTDSDSNVYRVPLGGGDPIMMAFGVLPGGWPLTIDRSYVYYGRAGQIARTLKSGTSAEMPIAINVPDPVDLALDPVTGTTLYWADWGTGLGNDGTIGKVGVDGGGQVVLESSLVTPQAVTVNASYVFWLSNGTLDDAGNNALSGTGALYRRAK